MKLYSQSYLSKDEKKIPNTTTHYILPNVYKDRNLIIFRLSKFRKNYCYSDFNSVLLALGFRIWKDKMIELQIFGWEY